MALVACPTASIGTTEHHDAHIGIDAFPALIAENVYFCGFTAESSFGAWSYLITRPASEGGNILVDSPRFATQLVKRIDAMGGIGTMFLTHRDDVADHSHFARRFGCARVMHADDGAARLGVERVLRGDEPVPVGHDYVRFLLPAHPWPHGFALPRQVSHRRSPGLVAES